MATIKVILRKKLNKDGTYPLALRITKDRKASYIGLGHGIKESDWDSKGQRVKKSHPNSTRMNNLILQKLAQANNTLLELETNERAISSQIISKQIKPKGGKSFFSQAKIFVDNLEMNGKYGRHKTEEGRVERFREFLKTHNITDITFPEISVNLLNQYRAYLKSTRDIKERTIVNHLLTIRTIYNQAAANHLTDKKNYPFGKDKVVIKFPDSIKIGWSQKEVKLLEEAVLTGYQDHARKVWLLSFYFAGMRLADVLSLKWSYFQDGRLHYAMNKNLKAGSLKIPDKALAILNTYRKDEAKHDFVLPELKVLEELTPYEVQRKISFAGKRLEENLKVIAKSLGIKKNISMHIARHTFAQLAGNKIPLPVLQKLYRHSHISTTAGYQSNFTNEETDNALNEVLG